jgi:hypothetical protein
MCMRFIGLDVHQKYAEGCEIGPNKQNFHVSSSHTPA